MRIAALLLWLAFPLGGYAVYLAYGTPHLIWSYKFRDNGSRYDLSVPRHYTSCTYLGWGPATVTIPAVAARCPWIRFFKEGSDQ